MSEVTHTIDVNTRFWDAALDPYNLERYYGFGYENIVHDLKALRRRLLGTHLTTDNGAPLMLYHGTEQRDLDEIIGGWFSDDPAVTKEFGSQMYRAYLRMTKPARHDPFIEQSDLVDEYNAMNGTAYSADEIEYDLDISLADKAVEGGPFQRWLTSKGYDGIITYDQTNAVEAVSYVPFDHEQVVLIKSNYDAISRYLASVIVLAEHSKNSTGKDIAANRWDLRDFYNWYGNSKLVDAEGRPLVLYRGLASYASINENALVGAPRDGYAVFTSTNPHLSATYANPDADNAVGAIAPMYVKADRLVEFDVKLDRHGNRVFDKFAFDDWARHLSPGSVLVARNVIDVGPRASLTVDPDRLFSYGSDVYAFGPGTEVRSAVGYALPAPGAIQAATVDNQFVDIANEHFRAWFKESRVLQDGKPAVVYHGTNTDLSAFEANTSGLIFFAKSPRYIDLAAKPAIVYPVYLSAQNIFDFCNDAHVASLRGRVSDEALSLIHDWSTLERNAAAIRAAGYDGIRFVENYEDETFENIAVFDPAQIKFALTSLEVQDTPALKSASVQTYEAPHSEGTATLSSQGPTQIKPLLDHDGSPLTLYHGTDTQFAAFDGASDMIWFTDDRNAAESFGDSSKTVTVHLSMANPARDRDVFNAANEIGVDPELIADEYGAKVLEVEGVRNALVAAGFDGAIVADATADGEEDITAYVAFDTSQITILEPQHKAGITGPVTDSAAFRSWFGDSYVRAPEGAPLVVYHGTNAHAYIEGEIETFATRPASGRGAAFFTNDIALAQQYGERVYPVYLSMQRPLVLLGEGSGWTNLHADTAISGAVPDLLRDASQKHADDINQIYHEMKDVFGEIDDTPVPPRIAADRTNLDGLTLGSLPGLNERSLETDVVVKRARELGFDGVIFKSIQDSPTTDPSYSRVIADVYAVFRPQQIKSATNNDGSFDPEQSSILRDISADPERFDFSLPADGNEIREVTIGDTTICLDLNANTGAIKVSSVRTPTRKRGKGSARAAMHRLVEQADMEGVTLTLAASPLDRRTSLGKLVSFYTSLGFAPTGRTINPAGDPEMRRIPSQHLRATNVIQPPSTPQPGESRVQPSSDSLGRPIGDGSSESIRSFWTWAADTQAVDATGRPLALFHGTTASFSQFDPSESFDGGFHFGTVEAASERIKYWLDGADDTARPNIMPVYLAIKNPLRLSHDPYDEESWAEVIEDAKQAGYDGIVYPNTVEGGESWVAFSPTQIKSAVGNDGAFSRNNPSILRDLPSDAAASEAFKTWFGPSVVTTSDGQPMVVYHGTTKVFSRFANSENGIFFSQDPQYASEYAGIGHDANVIPAHLRMIKPYRISATSLDAGEGLSIQEAKAAGYDGYIIDYEDNSDFAVFSDDQIVSAIATERDLGLVGSVHPSNKSQLDSAEFKQWFKDSKIVDLAGRPMVVYHGTLSVDIDAFEPGVDGAGWFARDPEIANMFSEMSLEDSTVYPVYLSIQNPLDTRTEAGLKIYHQLLKLHTGPSADPSAAELLAPHGYDGMICEEFPGKTTYLAFERSQIKSAIGNDGRFSSLDPSILRDTFGASISALKSQMLLQPGNVKLIDGFSNASIPRLRGVSRRGAKALLATIDTAHNAGEISLELAEFTKWMVSRSPAVATDLEFAVERTRSDGSAGTYNEATRVATIFRDRANSTSAVHEVLHHTERMLSPEMQTGIHRAWVAAYLKAWDGASAAVRSALDDMLAMERDPAAADRVAKAFRNGTLNYRKHYQLCNASEFWAMNATNILKERFEARGGWKNRAKLWIKEMTEYAKDFFGIDSDAAVLRGLRGVMNGSGKRLSTNIIKSLVARLGGPVTPKPVPQGASSDSNGPGAPDQNPSPIDTLAFKQWFGESAVRHPDGKPMRVFHGTSKSFEQFADLIDSDIGGANFGRKDFWHYFTPDAAEASQYAVHADQRSMYLQSDPQSARANVIPAYVSIQNPMVVQDDGRFGAMTLSPVSFFDLTRDEQRQRYLNSDELYDGIVIKHADGTIAAVATEYDFAIKSAIGNNGRFDSSDPRITHDIADPGSSPGLNGNVDASAITPTDNPSFMQWFGSSVTTDGQGKPRVLYHGTNKDITTFKGRTIWLAASPDLANLFVAGGRSAMHAKPKKGSVVYPLYAHIENPVDLRGLSLGAKVSMSEVLALAGIPKPDEMLRFIAQRNIDTGYAWISPSEGDPVDYLIKRYREGERLSDMLENRGLIDALKEHGRDGYWLQENIKTSKDAVESIPCETFAAFSPEQIKSAIGNTGAFDRSNQSILHDYASREPTDAFRTWFGDSKVVNEAGLPLVLYHGTDADFSIFSKGDIGFHFGSLETAHKRLDDVRNGCRGAVPAQQPAHEHIMPVYLSIRNPLRMTDAGDWDDEDVVADRLADLMIDDAFYEAYVAAEEKIEDLKGLHAFRAILEQMGYDGIVYENVGEGGGDSYIAFHPKQIKSAIGNTGYFDPSNQSILRDLPDDTGTPAFRAWFGQSKIVDDDGMPLRVFHGTSDGGFTEFSSRAAKGSSANQGAGDDGLGFFFTDDRSLAEYHRDRLDSVRAPWEVANKQVYEVYLSLQNPFVTSTGLRPDQRAELEKQGYDGVIYDLGSWKEYVVFYPGQIKSAPNNNGDFDPNHPSILRDIPAAPSPDGFEAWFMDSKVINASGAPRIVFHATSAQEDGQAIQVFKHGLGKRPSGPAIWLKTDPSDDRAACNASIHDVGTYEMPLFASVRRPLVVTEDNCLDVTERFAPDDEGDFPFILSHDNVAAIRSHGYDGIFVGSATNPKEIIVFDSTQLKSAIGNSGGFDPSEPSILRDIPDVSDAPSLDIWFAGSKVVDAHGAPLPVYHGSHDKFDEFNPVVQDTWVGPGMNDCAPVGRTFFSTNKKVARSYGKHVSKVYLNVQNPFVVDAEGKSFIDLIPAYYIGPAISGGYDGVIIKNIRDGARGYGAETLGDTIIIFQPDQIKLTDAFPKQSALANSCREGEQIDAVPSMASARKPRRAKP